MMKGIQLLLLDVDGVLTDGAIIYDRDGSETKIFNVKDGLGLKRPQCTKPHHHSADYKNATVHLYSRTGT